MPGEEVGTQDTGGEEPETGLGHPVAGAEGGEDYGHCGTEGTEEGLVVLVG